MKLIGIDESTHDIYETSNTVWHSVWPATPVLSVARFVQPQATVPALEHDLGSAKTLFREDSFDPITRIRRGRFYKASGGSRPSPEYALPHPLYGSLGSGPVSANGRCERWLFVFEQYQSNPPENRVMIGSDESLWRVLGAERIITGEYLVTLKARHALGILPELNPDAVPEIGREKAIETFEKLADSAYRETPGSIIDRARDVAQWFLAVWIAHEKQDESFLKKDLGDLIKHLESRDKNEPKAVSSASWIVARLHSRGKPNEQEKHDTRPLMEADAEFALAAIGLLLREFEWGA